MFTVFEEAVINLDGKLKQEMEQSTALQVCQRVFGRLNLVCVIAGHCGHQLNPDDYKSSVVCSFTLSQPYWDCEDYASGSGESLLLISQGLYPSLSTDFIVGKGKWEMCELYW